MKVLSLAELTRAQVMSDENHHQPLVPLSRQQHMSAINRFLRIIEAQLSSQLPGAHSAMYLLLLGQGPALPATV
jgi:hypothetical protein